MKLVTGLAPRSENTHATHRPEHSQFHARDTAEVTGIKMGLQSIKIFSFMAWRVFYLGCNMKTLTESSHIFS